MSALHARQVLDFLFQEHVYLLGIDSELLENEVAHVASLLHQGLQQMNWLYGLLSRTLRKVHSPLDCFLRLDCKLVECHIRLLSLLLILIF